MDNEFVEFTFSSLHFPVQQHSMVTASQEFGDPKSNGLGHQETTTINPLTQRPCAAVFVPKHRPGYWSGSIDNVRTLADHQVIDDDVDALRAGQLCLG